MNIFIRRYRDPIKMANNPHGVASPGWKPLLYGVETAVQELGLKVVQAHPKSFDLSEICAKSQKNWEKKPQNFTTLLMELYFLVIECIKSINESLLKHRKHIK